MRDSKTLDVIFSKRWNDKELTSALEFNDKVILVFYPRSLFEFRLDNFYLKNVTKKIQTMDRISEI